MLSFFAPFPNLPLFAKSCHLLFPASSSLFALTFRGTFAGLARPSLTLLGSSLACEASARLIFAAAEITFEFGAGEAGKGVAGLPSALRFRSLMGYISCAFKVSVVL